MEFAFLRKMKAYGVAVLLQLVSASLVLTENAAMNSLGTSHYALCGYRSAISAAVFAPFALFSSERQIRPRMTFTICIKIVLLGLFNVIGENCFDAGMSYTSATFVSAMHNLVPALTFLLDGILSVIGENCFDAGVSYTSVTFALATHNLVPALTFLVAGILRLQKVNLKILMGTIVGMGGTVIITLIGGPVIGLSWTHEISNNSSLSDPIKGALLIGIGCLCFSIYDILEANMLETYSTRLSLMALIHTLGALQGIALGFAIERGNTGIWALGWDARLLIYLYHGVASGVNYYLLGVIEKDKGSLFVKAFVPFNMVIVAISSSIIFSEQMSVGLVTGAAVIVFGHYLVIWGKINDARDG